MLNALIATAQRQANALQKAGAAGAAAIGDLADWEGGETECGFGLHSPESTHKPPNEWFDPVDETFLYEPETWMIGLSLMPWTIFAPWLWGPPITMPVTGPLYWVLDDSHVNWLDAQIKDFEKWLQDNKDNLDLDEEIDGECEIDYNLEFGLASEMKAQKKIEMSRDLTNAASSGEDNDDGGSSGGGSSY